MNPHTPRAGEPACGEFLIDETTLLVVGNLGFAWNGKNIRVCLLLDDKVVEGGDSYKKIIAARKDYQKKYRARQKARSVKRKKTNTVNFSVKSRTDFLRELVPGVMFK